MKKAYYGVYTYTLVSEEGGSFDITEQEPQEVEYIIHKDKKYKITIEEIKEENINA